jgi:hypothetical protein
MPVLSYSMIAIAESGEDQHDMNSQFNRTVDWRLGCCPTPSGTGTQGDTDASAAQVRVVRQPWLHRQRNLDRAHDQNSHTWRLWPDPAAG